jgi:hypothetical protein
MTYSRSRDAINASANRDMSCILRNTKVNLLLLVHRGVTAWFNCIKIQEISVLKMGQPKCLNASIPIVNQLTLTRHMISENLQPCENQNLDDFKFSLDVHKNRSFMSVLSNK